MKKSNRKSRKAGQFKTLSAFAAALKAPVSTVHGWTKHERWEWSRKSPWPASIIPAVRRWVDATMERGRPARAVGAIDDLELPRASDRAEERQAKLKILHERGQRLELERLELQGRLLDADEVTRGQLERIQAVKHAMRDAAFRIADRLLEARTADRPTIEAVVLGEMRRVATRERRWS